MELVWTYDKLGLGGGREGGLASRTQLACARINALPLASQRETFWETSCDNQLLVVGKLATDRHRQAVPFAPYKFSRESTPKEVTDYISLYLL